jgi:signal transduction histidine kinase
MDAARTAAPQLTITHEVEGELDVAGDPQQLRDLFTSLVENACRYTPAGGCVTLHAHAHADADADANAVVEIRDTGIGLTPEDLKRAHERFYRGPAARRMFPSGSGLGLAIAERIVGLHHGEMSLMANENGGTCVRVELPLVD